jgi:electron transfer flavoprotein beta subunit
LEDGWYQYVTLPLPAVLTIQSGIKKLRYATLMGIKKAKTKEVRTISVTADGGADLHSQAATAQIYLPPKNKGIQMLSGEPRAIAQQLVEKLKFEARVI